MKWVGCDLRILSVVSLVCLGGCVMPAQTAPANPAIKTGAAFTLQTPIDQIAADPRGKAILERDLPGMLASPRYPLFSDMSLSQLAPLSDGRLTDAKLSQVEEDLAGLSSEK